MRRGLMIAAGIAVLMGSCASNSRQPEAMSAPARQAEPVQPAPESPTAPPPEAYQTEAPARRRSAESVYRDSIALPDAGKVSETVELPAAAGKPGRPGGTPGVNAEPPEKQ
jgi:hypothetical protein